MINSSFITPALVLILLVNCLSLYYLIFWLPGPDSLKRSLLKIAPMAGLITIAFYFGVPILVALALIACMIGDYFLSLEGDRNFISGLSAFLIGHLFYISFFIGDFKSELLSHRLSIETAVVLLALIIIVLFRLWQYLGEMKIPVIVYALTIGAMAFFAKLADPGLFILAGIVLFVISDVILANDKFTPLGNSLARKLMPYAVWFCYFSGQSLIVSGFVL